MPVHGLDHVNIVTDRLEETVEFYARLLGLTRRDNGAAAMGFRGAWMCDSGGNAIVHLVDRSSRADYAPEHTPGLPTAAVHHVAFRAEGFADTLTRARAIDSDCRVNDFQHAGFRQILLKDPNNINIELNFSGD